MLHIKAALSTEPMNLQSRKKKRNKEEFHICFLYSSWSIGLQVQRIKTSAIVSVIKNKQTMAWPNVGTLPRSHFNF